MDNQEINQVRGYYKLPSHVTDEQIQKDLNNSLGLTVIRIGKAKKNLVNALSKIMTIKSRSTSGH